MVAGQWTNADGLPLNFGVTKALPELAGDYLAYGETRVLETYITYGQTFWGTAGGMPVIPVMANSTFNGTGTPQTAGLISLTYGFPLQTTTVGAGTGAGFISTSGTLAINTTQIWVDEMSFEVLSTFTGTANAFGIGLVLWNSASSIWQIVTPNGSGSGIPNHFLQATNITGLTAGQRWTWNSDPAAVPWGSTSGGAPVVPAAGWLGNIPKVTNTGATSNSVAYLAAVATSAPLTSGTHGGLARFRLKYNIYGNIVQ